MFKEKIIIEMKEVFKEIPFGIEHTLKVLKNAEDIMKISERKKKNSSVLLLYYMILVRLKHKKNTVLLMVSIKKRKDQQ